MAHPEKFQQGSSGGDTFRERGRPRTPRRELSPDPESGQRSISRNAREREGTYEVSPPEAPPTPKQRFIPLPEEGSTEHDGHPIAVQGVSDLSATVMGRLRNSEEDVTESPPPAEDLTEFSLLTSPTAGNLTELPPLILSTSEVSDSEIEERRSVALRHLDSLLSSQTDSGSNSNDRTATPEQDLQENDLPEDQRQEMPEELYTWREHQDREVKDYGSFAAASEYIEKLDEQQISEYAKDIGKYMKELDETAYENRSYEWREHPSPEAAIYPSFGAALEQNERDIHVVDEHARAILTIRESGDPVTIQFVEEQNARMEQDHPGLYAYLQRKIRQLGGGVL